MYIDEEPEFQDLERRVARIEAILGEERLLEADEFIRELDAEACVRGEHDYKQTAYDLQGGKWGEDTCTRCGHKRSWHV